MKVLNPYMVYLREIRTDKIFGKSAGSCIEPSSWRIFFELLIKEISFPNRRSNSYEVLVQLI